METISERYGVIFQFCPPDMAAQKIMEMLANGKLLKCGD